MTIQPPVAFTMLTANAEAFLKLYPVRIFGDTGASGQADYDLENRGASHRPGEVLGTHRLHATESFNMKAAAIGLVNPGAHRFRSHSVHMDLGIGAMNFYRLGAAGPGIVVTGQLSGCAFVIAPAGGNDLDVAHVKPTGGVTGSSLAASLAAAHPNAFVYGATAGHGFYDSHDRVVSIIGIRDLGGAWRLYAQKHDANSGDYTIRSVHRLHPDHTKL